MGQGVADAAVELAAGAVEALGAAGAILTGSEGKARERLFIAVLSPNHEIGVHVPPAMAPPEGDAH